MIILRFTQNIHVFTHKTRKSSKNWIRYVHDYFEFYTNSRLRKARKNKFLQTLNAEKLEIFEFETQIFWV